MEYLVHHGRELLILAISPFLGMSIEIAFSTRTIRVILITMLVLLTPLLTGYNYVLSYAYSFLTLILLACLYAFFSRQIRNQILKFVAALFSSGLLLAVFGYAFFIDVMGGRQTTEKKWKSEGYQIEFVRDQGFAGRPLLKYELSKFTAIPIFIKKIETVAENDSIENCDIRFNKSGVVFNKCTGTLQNARQQDLIK